eukprot:5371939-Prorocentrum_lima.AAC.1
MPAAGPQRGVLGLCGRDSLHFWAVPMVAHRLQAARPDLLDRFTGAQFARPWVCQLMPNAHG